MVKKSKPVEIDGVTYVSEAHHVEETTVMLEYIKLLEEELQETTSIALIHGWKSRRHEQGKALRRSLGSKNPELPLKAQPE